MRMRSLGLGLVVLGAVAVGCSSSGNTTGTPNPQENYDPQDPTQQPPNAAQCGADCTTDLGAARAALEAGNYAQALELYRCADTSEAAFGAGLARLLVMLEEDAANTLMADLGLAPLVATDFLGANSIVARLTQRWDGSGSLTLAGDLAATLSFDSAQQTTGDYPEFYAENIAGRYYDYLDIEVDSAAGLVAGNVMSVKFDCAASYPVRTANPPLSYVTLNFDQDGESYWCSMPYSFDSAVCEPDGGRIAVAADGTTPGQHVAYDIENLLLSCSTESDWETPLLVRVSGNANGIVVTDSVDVTGLHPMFSEGYDFEGGLPATSTVAMLQQHAVALTPALEEAACFFRRAGAGAGVVYQLPGVLVGDQDVAFTQGDAQVMGAALLLSGAFVQLASAAESPIPVRDLICSSDDVGCPTEGELVDTFNQTFGQTFHADQFAVARRLVAEAAPLLDAGLGNLDNSSLLIANATSMPGLLMIRDVVQAANAALTVQTVLPHVTPAVNLNLGAFFATARNPQDVPIPIIEYTQQCDDWGCWSSSEINTSFIDAYLDGTTDADWVNGDYEWADEDAVTDALGESLSHALGQFVGGGG